MTGVTAQDRASFRQVRSFVVRPMMSTGERKRETKRAVMPESEQAMIALASMSMAMPQVAWLMASTMFLT